MSYKCLLSLILVLGFNTLGILPIKAQASIEERTQDFKIRGFHLDLRIQVMTPQALKEFANELSDMEINTLVMEWEGTYPFKKHATISNRFSYTREEVKDFISYCEDLKIQVIPLQQSLGHVEYILRNPRYSNLKEDRKNISQLCPIEVSGNKALFTELFSDLAKMHNSDYIHIGGDETHLLGHCQKCAKKVREHGKSKLFVDHMKMIAGIVMGLGKTPVMWADIILKYPEAASEIPKETIFVDWNYGWDIDHFGDISGLQKKGFSFWGAPAIRCHPDNWYVTDWATHFKNQKEFIPYARKAGYKGLIMTSWSTTGVYGFTWDVGYDVIDMVQVRNTYPMSGFRILIASYAKALKTNEPLNPAKFIIEYGKNRFGLSNKESQVLLEFLFSPPELINNGKPDRIIRVQKTKEEFGKIRDRLISVKPQKNQKEFAHYKLMADLRMYYLIFKEVEAKYNSPDFSSSQTPLLLKELDGILIESEKLNKRFFELNKGFLYDAELKEQNYLRNQAVHVLYDRLAKLK